MKSFNTTMYMNLSSATPSRVEVDTSVQNEL